MILRIAIVTVIGISSITFNVFTTDIKSITLNFNVNELSDETIASNNVYYIKKVYFCSVKC